MNGEDQWKARESQHFAIESQCLAYYARSNNGETDARVDARFQRIAHRPDRTFRDIGSVRDDANALLVRERVYD